MLVKSLAAQTSGHESRIVWQTKLSAAGVSRAENKRSSMSGATVAASKAESAHARRITAPRGGAQ
eukprot:scaffold50990_cov61-Phaeocystis_antarctica.AAC.4